MWLRSRVWEGQRYAMGVGEMGKSQIVQGLDYHGNDFIIRATGSHKRILSDMINMIAKLWF